MGETLKVEVSDAQESVERLSAESNQEAETILKLENTLDEVIIQRPMLQTQVATLEEEKKSSERSVDSSIAEEDTSENTENRNLEERLDLLERQEKNLEEVNEPKLNLLP